MIKKEKRMRKSSILLGSLAMLGTVTVFAAKPVQIKGTNISITPPKGFVQAKRFPGLMNKPQGASLIVVNVPVAFDKLKQGFSAENLKKKNMELLSRKEIKFEGKNATFLNLSQKAGKLTYHKWLLFFGSPRSTTMIMGVYPAQFEKQLSKTVKEAVLGAKIIKGAKNDAEQALAFTIKPVAPFKKAFCLGGNIAFTPDGKFGKEQKTKAFFFAGPSSTKGMKIQNKKSFAEAVIKKLANMKNVKIEKISPTKLNGLDGFEVIANAFDVDKNTPRIIYQVILFEKTDYYLILGIADQKEDKKYLPLFKQMVDSFKVK
jgi:hypothetical protein